jgi:hypothetical protein
MSKAISQGLEGGVHEPVNCPFGIFSSYPSNRAKTKQIWTHQSQSLSPPLSLSLIVFDVYMIQLITMNKSLKKPPSAT